MYGQQFVDMILELWRNLEGLFRPQDLLTPISTSVPDAHQPKPGLMSSRASPSHRFTSHTDRALMDDTRLSIRNTRPIQYLSFRRSMDQPKTGGSAKLNLKPRHSLSSPKSDSELIELAFISERITASTPSSSAFGHHFCSIPLSVDTFCDHCGVPVFGFGWGPVCQKCADCHMICHWECTKSVKVRCEGKISISCVPILETDVSPGENADDADVLEVIDSSNASSFTNVITDSMEKLTLNNKLIQSTDPHAPLPCDPNNTSLSLNQGSSDEFSEATTCTEVILAPSVGSSEPPPRNSNLFNSNFIHNGEHSSDSTQYQTALLIDPIMNEASKPDKNTATAEFFKPPVPSSGLLRSTTNVQNLRNIRKTRLSACHSFLSGQRPNASIYSRLSYDFSSLDKEAITKCGILVHQFQSENLINKSQCKIAPLSVYNYSEQNVPPYLQSSDQVTNTSSTIDIGLGTVMQSTQAFLQSKLKRFAGDPITGSSGSVPLIQMVVGPIGDIPWSVDRLRELLNIFNTNEFGLKAHNVDSLNPIDCKGQIRIHINLIRPVRMSFTSPLCSVYDLCTNFPEKSDMVYNISENPSTVSDTQSAGNVPTVMAYNNTEFGNVDIDNQGFSQGSCQTFSIPRGSTKLVHIRLSTTAQVVIKKLLNRFGIKDNPQKFALYEHTIVGDQEVTVRKLLDNESPLGLLFKWVEQDPHQFNRLLDRKRLVLQENETGDIEWSMFSLSELHTFLGILNREEANYRRRIEMIAELRKNEIKRLLRLRKKKQNTQMIENDAFSVSVPDEDQPCSAPPDEGFIDGSVTLDLVYDNLNTDTHRGITSSAFIESTNEVEEPVNGLLDDSVKLNFSNESIHKNCPPDLSPNSASIKAKSGTLPAIPQSKIEKHSSKIPSIFRQFAHFRTRTLGRKSRKQRRGSESKDH